MRSACSAIGAIWRWRDWRTASRPIGISSLSDSSLTSSCPERSCRSRESVGPRCDRKMGYGRNRGFFVDPEDCGVFESAEQFGEECRRLGGGGSVDDGAIEFEECGGVSGGDSEQCEYAGERGEVDDSIGWDRMEISWVVVSVGSGDVQAASEEIASNKNGIYRFGRYGEDGGNCS